MRRANKTPEDKDAEERRIKGGAFSTKGEEGPHQGTRVSAGKRGTSSRRARTPCRVQVTGSADEAQKDLDDAGGAEMAGNSSMAVEGPRQQARLSTLSRGIPDRRARASRLGRKADRVVNTQEELGA